MLTHVQWYDEPSFDPSSSSADATTFPSQSFVDTLQAIHNTGFIHGDISRSNLLVNEKGDTCIIDFHLAMRTSRAQLKFQEMNALKEILGKKLAKVRGL